MSARTASPLRPNADLPHGLVEIGGGRGSALEAEETKPRCRARRRRRRWRRLDGDRAADAARRAGDDGDFARRMLPRPGATGPADLSRSRLRRRLALVVVRHGVGLEFERVSARGNPRGRDGSRRERVRRIGSMAASAPRERRRGRSDSRNGLCIWRRIAPRPRRLKAAPRISTIRERVMTRRPRRRGASRAAAAVKSAAIAASPARH